MLVVLTSALLGCSANGSGESRSYGAGATAGAGGSSAGSGGSQNTGGGAAGNGGTVEPPDASAGGGGDDAGPDASAGSGGSSGVGGSGGTVVDAAWDVPIYDGNGCTGLEVAAEPFPLDMYVMMDQSGSMGAPVNLYNPFGPTQWDAVKQAFLDFFAGTSPDGMSMGIQYFPLPIDPWSSFGTCTSSGSGCGAGTTCVSMDNGRFCMDSCSGSGGCSADSECMSLDGGDGGTVYVCSNDSCNAGDYATPEVPIQPIPGVNQQIVNSLNAHGPTSMTPSAPALEGAVDYAHGWAVQHPSHTTIVVFATDGQPTACTDGALQPVNKVKQAAANGLNGSPSIKTFVIGIIPMGMGTMTNGLHGVAAAGGTGQAFIIDVNQDMSAQLQAALEAIRGAFMQCEFQIPNPGYPLDFGEVNVIYTATNGDEYPVYYVGDLAHCDPANGGWYYDVDPAMGTPTKISLCPASCSFVQNYGGSIRIEIGCETIRPPT